MPNTYTNITDSRVAVGGDLDEDIHDDLRDNQLSCRTQTAVVTFEENSTTTTGSWEPLATHYEWFPSLGTYTGLSARFVLVFEAKVTGGNADYRLVEVGAATNGSSVNVTASSYDPDTPTTVSVAVANGDLGSVRELRLEVFINAGTEAFARGTARADSYKDF